MNINTMAKTAYKNAVRLGKIGDRTPIEKLKDVQSEYMEALKALNNNDHADWDGYYLSIDGSTMYDHSEGFTKKMMMKYFDEFVKDTYEDELTDLLKVILTLMEDCGMDKEKHWNYKTKYNELREDHK